MSAPVVLSRIVTADPPPTGIPNPIHDASGADAAGYAGALVAGVRTYGWATEAIVEALGSEWLASGWVDLRLRRPLFAGEELTTTVAPGDPGGSGGAGEVGGPGGPGGSGSFWSLTCVGRGRGGERVVLDGTAGLGQAPWLAEMQPPAPAPGLDPPAVRPTYDLDSAPRNESLRPLSVYLTAETARSLAVDDLELDDPRYRAPVPPIHPYFLAGRLAPLTRHNFTYGPTIHVRSQIQHRATSAADTRVTVGATIVDAYDRNDHWYQVLDGTVTAGGQHGLDTELATIRHHTIFRPRGTTLPPPLTEG